MKAHIWEEKYILAKNYFEKNGNLLVKNDYVVNNIRLGRWLDTQRNDHFNNKLSKEKIDKLNNIGMVWHKFNEQWDRNFSLAKNYFETNRNLLIPSRYSTDGVNLGMWISDQRKSYKRGYLNDYRIKKLNSIGMIWDELDYNWKQQYNFAQSFYNKYGHLFIPQDYELNSFKIGKWLSTQKSEYKRGNLNTERITLLESIGMIWDFPPQNQTSFFEQAVFFYIKKSIPNAINKYTSLGFELDIFIKNLKLAIEYDGPLHKLKKDLDKNFKCKDHDINLIRIREPGCPILNDTSIDFLLKDISIKELESTINDVFSFINKTYNTGISIDIDILRDKQDIYDQYIKYINHIWLRNFELAKEFYSSYNHLLIPARDKFKSTNLGSWISRQRKEYKKGLLSDDKINKLESIGMIWDVNENNWSNYFNSAESFFNKNKHLLVPERYVDDDNIILGKWLVNQRQSYKNKTLSTNKIKKLESIGMVWDVRDLKWDIGFNIAKKYFLDNGNLYINTSLVIEDFNLGSWVSEQRKLYNLGTLSADRINRLNSIDMIWNHNEYTWNYFFKLAEEFSNQHNSLLVPYKYKVNNINLGIWISRQRKKFKENKLAESQIKRLNSLGMIWSIKRST